MVRNAVSGEHFSGRWADIGSPERLAVLDAALRGERGQPVPRLTGSTLRPVLDLATRQRDHATLLPNFGAAWRWTLQSVKRVHVLNRCFRRR